MLRSNMGRPQKYFLGDRKRTISELTDLHRQIMALLLLGKKKSHIARELGLSPSEVTQITNSPLFLREYKEREFQVSQNVEEVRDYLRSFCLEAAKREIEIALNSRNEQVALGAIKDIQDRVGLSRDINVNIRGQIMTANYSDEELRRLVLKRLQNLGIISAKSTNGEVIDAVFDETRNLAKST